MALICDCEKFSGGKSLTTDIYNHFDDFNRQLIRTGLISVKTEIVTVEQFLLKCLSLAKGASRVIALIEKFKRKVRTPKGSEPDNVRAFDLINRATTSATESRPAER